MIKIILILVLLAPTPALMGSGVSEKQVTQSKKKMMPPPPARKPLITGKFNLVDVRTGDRRTQNDFKGKYQLVFFGFTFCKIICLERRAQQKSQKPYIHKVWGPENGENIMYTSIWASQSHGNLTYIRFWAPPRNKNLTHIHKSYISEP